MCWFMYTNNTFLVAVFNLGMPFPLQVATALGSLKFPYVYPDPESRHLRAALAEDSGLESEYILAGCGADELIDLIMRLPSRSFISRPFSWYLCLKAELSSISWMVQLQMCAWTRRQNCWLPSNIHNVWVRCFSQWRTCHQGCVASLFFIFLIFLEPSVILWLNLAQLFNWFFSLHYMHLPILIFHSPSSNVVPRLPDFSLDIDRIVKVVEQENPKCIFLTSPNNPDGR